MPHVFVLLHGEQQYSYTFCRNTRKLGFSSVPRSLLALMKIRAYDRALCDNKFTWCFHKVPLVFLFVQTHCTFMASILTRQKSFIFKCTYRFETHQQQTSYFSLSKLSHYKQFPPTVLTQYEFAPQL